MGTARQIIHQIIDEIPEARLATLLEYVMFVRRKGDAAEFEDLLESSQSSMDFWNNPTDDEVWKDGKDMESGTLPKISNIRSDKIYTLSQNMAVKKYGRVNDTVFELVQKNIGTLIG
jgi:hypothetical protein